VRSAGKLAATLAVGALAVYLPFTLSPGNLTLYTLMGLAAIVAIGLSLLMGFAGQISLGQGAFYALGAYVVGVLATPADLFPKGRGVDPLLALVAAPLACAVVAAVLGVPLLRLRGHYLAFATLALHLIALALIFTWESWTGGQIGLIGIPPLEVGGRTVTGESLAAIVWAIVLVTLLIGLSLVASRAGRALRAIATSETGAAAAGINVPVYKLQLFVFSAALAGLAGGMYAYLLQYLSPDAFPLVISITYVVMVAVGGMGSLYGAVVGAIAITWLQDQLQQFGTREELLGFDLPVQAPQVFSIGVFGAILIVVMLFFPRGLLPGLQGLGRRARGAMRPRLATAPRL
jgi:branched-chain amino acid transport system permease protein